MGLTLIDYSMDTYVPTGNSEQDEYQRQILEKELMRIKRNAERREARERLKAKNGIASPAARSPGASELDGPSSNQTAAADNTPQKGKGRSKDGTQRKCANCGLVGHIKTNRKSVTTFTCPLCVTKQNIEEDTSSHGRRRDSKRAGGANGGAAGQYSAFVL